MLVTGYGFDQHQNGILLTLTPLTTPTMVLPSLEILTAPEAPACAVALGVLLHLFFFRLGEWDLATVKLIVGFTTSIAALSVALALIAPELGGNVWAAFKTSMTLNYSVLAGVYASMLVYRAAFHRLGKFPGPFGARLSNLWITGKSIGKQDKYLVIQDLHKKYGDVVRIGRSSASSHS